MSRREIRSLLDGYFGQVKHQIVFVKCKGRTLIDIEYTDFRSEQVVASEIHHLIGTDFFLNIKRECSEALMEEIRCFLSSDVSGRKTMLLMMANFVKP